MLSMAKNVCIFWFLESAVLTKREAGEKNAIEGNN
jgi:hypothetical protein